VHQAFALKVEVAFFAACALKQFD